MIRFTKNFSFIMILICCMPQFIQSTYIYDQYGRNQLMNYLINIETEIANKASYANQMWNKYFYQERIVTGCYVIQGHMHTTYKYITLRKNHTTDENVAEYTQVYYEYKAYIQDVLQDIKIMIAEGADLQTYDKFGKTVIDYCYTSEIYNVLRENGAPFSLQAWCYFNPNEAILAGIAGTFTTFIAGIIAVGEYRKAYGY